MRPSTPVLRLFLAPLWPLVPPELLPSTPALWPLPPVHPGSVAAPFHPPRLCGRSLPSTPALWPLPPVHPGSVAASSHPPRLCGPSYLLNYSRPPRLCGRSSLLNSRERFGCGGLHSSRAVRLSGNVTPVAARPTIDSLSRTNGARCGGAGALYRHNTEHEHSRRTQPPDQPTAHRTVRLDCRNYPLYDGLTHCLTDLLTV